MSMRGTRIMFSMMEEVLSELVEPKNALYKNAAFNFQFSVWPTHVKCVVVTHFNWVWFFSSGPFTSGVPFGWRLFSPVILALYVRF